MKEPNHHTAPKHLDELIEHARRFCAFRERCVQETQRKLRQLGATAPQTEAVLSVLTDEGFVDDRRFAYAFAHGKFTYNNWGKEKIHLELLSRGISENTIGLALGQIPDDAYFQTLKKLAEKKHASLKGKDAGYMTEKTVQYCLQKGYEASLVWDIVKQL